MTTTDSLSSSPTHVTENERHKPIFITLDLSEEIHTFICDLDMSVDDISYDVAGIVEHYTTRLGTSINTGMTEKLSRLFLSRGVIKNYDDAGIAADHALIDLYPVISDLLYDLGYVHGEVHQVDYQMTRHRRSIKCWVLMRIR